MTDTARLVDLAISRTSDGSAGYAIENPFGQSVQVLPRPPAFRAVVVLEWQGAMPEEIRALIERARSVGIDPGPVI